jgi:tyrosine-protein kinase Etk/Wzc
VQLQSMRTYVTEDNPQYIMAEQELDALRAQLAKMAGPGANTTADIDVSKTHIPETGMEYMNRLRDVRYYETITDLIARQFEAAKIDEAHQGTLEVSDVAVPPDKKSSPKRAIAVTIAAGIGFLIASLFCLVADVLDRLRRDPDDRRRLEALRAALR